MLCLHFGPGRLGLGLVVDQLEEAGFEICLIGSPDAAEPEQQQFGLAFVDPERGLDYRTVGWASNARSVTDLPVEVLRALRAGDPVLITCALGRQIAARAEFIVELVSLRPPAAETVLLACENDPHEVYASIAERCGAAVSVCPCVVDRICSWPTVVAIDERAQRTLIERPRDALSRRVVHVHPVGEWLIPTETPRAATLTRLSRAPLVRLIAPESEGYVARKRWLVGGVHMVLALVARLARLDALPLGEGEQREFLRIAAPLMEAMSGAVAREWPQAAPSPNYVPERIRAFVESPDTTARILAPLLVRHDLAPLMCRVEERIGTAARTAVAAGESCEPFYEAMALLVSVLADPRLYYPQQQPVELREAVDEQAIELFAASLCGWLDERRAAALVKDLRGALAAQRSLRQSPRS